MDEANQQPDPFETAATVLDQKNQQKQQTEQEQAALKAHVDAQDAIRQTIVDTATQALKFIAQHQPKVSVTNQQPFPSSIATPDVKAVVDALNKLIGATKQPDLSSIVAGLNSLETAVKSIPAQIDIPENEKVESVEVSNQMDYTAKFDELNKSIGGIELSPKIDVKPILKPNLDLADIPKTLQQLLKAVDKIKLPDIPKTDLKPVTEAVNAVQKAINSLTFPVANYVLPFKDSGGKATQAQVDSSGNIVTAAATPPTALLAFVTTVTVAGTRIQLPTNTVVNGFILEAPSTNTGLIYVGGSNVSSTVYGGELQPGQSTSVAIDNTNKIWLDSSINGQSCALIGS